MDAPPPSMCYLWATMGRGHAVLFAIVAGVAPFLVFAQVTITDIMYDPTGADTGREWVEVLNAGTSSVRLSDLKLRTNGVNHKIIALSGDGILPPQTPTVIVQDPALFSVDKPGFAGAVFRASFSLTNKSGMVEIVDKSGAVVASKSYQAPPPTPAPPKQKFVKTKKTSESVQKEGITDSGISEEIASESSIEDDQKDTKMAASAALPAGVTDSGSSPLWWMGTIALAGVASVATFASRHIAKREWDIVEEKEGA